MWRNVTLPFPETGIRFLPQNSLGMFVTSMQTCREELEEVMPPPAARLTTAFCS